ncbi:MAG: energy transducer TonB [Acidobacteriota bacterium]
MARFVSTLVLMAVFVLPASQTGRAQKADFGPAVKNYLLGLEEEFKELDFQLRNGELSRAIHVRSRARLQILRRFVERLAAEREEDRVPELEVLTAEELGALGLATRPNPGELQPGMRLGDRWDVVAIEPGRPPFFVFERVGADSAEARSKGNSKVDPRTIIETVIIPDPVEPAPPPVTPSAPIEKQPVDETVATAITRTPPPQIDGPKILRFYLPSYSQQARAKGIEGELVVSAVFRRDGKIKDIIVEQGLGHGLDDRARDSVKRTEFEPAMLSHQAIDVRTRIVFNFSLMKVTVRVREPEPISEVRQ